MVSAPYSQESAAAAATIPPNTVNPVTKALSDVSEKYAAEREKRARPDGLSQYIDLSKSDKFKQFQADNWVDYKAINTQDPPLKDGSFHKFLILGAGYGGLLFATRLVQAGISAKDIFGWWTLQEALAGPGTGIGTLESCAILRATFICLCLRRWTICLSTSTHMVLSSGNMPTA